MDLRAFVKDERDVLTDKWFSGIGDLRNIQQLSVLSDEAFERCNQDLFSILLGRFLEESEEVKSKHIDEFANKLKQLGWPLTYLSRAMQHFKGVILDVYVDKNRAENYRDVSRSLDVVLDPVMAELTKHYDEYVSYWEKTADIQRRALRELSAPLIPVFDKIAVMPLIGTIDTERASLIMENLLEGVIKHEAHVVLIDITGVPVVDTMVAHHIIQATEAVRLVGAKCILVGIRPEIAQTIVSLGIDLTDITTLSTLQKGIRMGLRLTGRTIVDVESDN